MDGVVEPERRTEGYGVAGIRNRRIVQVTGLWDNS